MQESNYQWSDLFLKYLANNISDSELEELHRQIATSEWKREQFLRVSDPDHFIGAMMEHTVEDTQKGWEKLTRAIPAFRDPVIIPLYKRRGVIFAAAVVVTIAAIGIIYLITAPVKDAIPYSYVENENKERVNIDKAGNGVVLNYCLSQVIKNKDTLEIRTKLPYGSSVCPQLIVSVAPGKMWILKYSDGSVSRLNASTSIKFPVNFNNKLRHVDILGGECDFGVARNNMAPFMVAAGDVTIRAEGTLFNVNAYKDGPVVATLIEGKIRVSAGKKELLLGPGQQARYTDNQLDTFTNVNLEQVQAWTQNFFDFKDISIEQTMKEIGAWYGYEIIVKAKLTTVAHNSTIDRSLPMMNVFHRLVPDLKITISGKKIYITDP